MSRTTKNIIMGIVLTCLIGSSIFTIYLASNKSNVNNNLNNTVLQNNKENPPNMPNWDYDSDNNSDMMPPALDNGSNSNRQAPPDKPDNGNIRDNNKNNPSDIPEDNNFGEDSNRQSPPSSQNNSTDIENDNKKGSDEMPNFQEEENNPPSNMPSEDDNFQFNHNIPHPNMVDLSSQKSSISTIYYLLFGMESLLIALTLIYLIMSNFNKKNFKETLKTSDKTIIFCLATTLLTIGLTYLDSVIATKI